MILPHDTTVVVVDGTRIRMFRNIGREPHIELAALPQPDFGGSNTGSGSRHRNSSANPDSQRIREDKFVAGVAEHLNREALSNNIKQLVIIADPRTLGELRRHLHDVLASRIIGQISKDLTSHSYKSIQAAIVNQ